MSGPREPGWIVVSEPGKHCTACRKDILPGAEAYDYSGCDQLYCAKCGRGAERCKRISDMQWARTKAAVAGARR